MLFTHCLTAFYLDFELDWLDVYFKFNVYFYEIFKLNSFDLVRIWVYIFLIT
jgi:hypothetical protein